MDVKNNAIEQLGLKTLVEPEIIEKTYKQIKELKKTLQNSRNKISKEKKEEFNEPQSREFTDEDLRRYVDDFNKVSKNLVKKLDDELEDVWEAYYRIGEILDQITNVLKHYDLKEAAFNSLVKEGIDKARAFETIYGIPYDPNKRWIKVRGNALLEYQAEEGFRESLKKVYEEDLIKFANNLMRKFENEFSSLEEALEEARKMMPFNENIEIPDAVFDDVYM